MIMPASWNQNRLTAKLGIEYPIIQGPLGGLSSQRLTAAVSNFGGLGSFGAHEVSAFLTSLVEEISEIAGPIMQWSAARREKQILD
jgi:NAD(P)H-dependent flavin oxidoreductase YrpB (nitropropane dioxygenase family)